MAFPSISRDTLSVDVEYVDNKIQGVSEDDYVSRRPRTTRNTKKFMVTYDLLPTADRDALVTHYSSVGMHTAFSWTDNESNTYTVYYNKPLKFRLAFPGWYKIDTIELIEQ